MNHALRLCSWKCLIWKVLWYFVTCKYLDSIWLRCFKSIKSKKNRPKNSFYPRTTRELNSAKHCLVLTPYQQLNYYDIYLYLFLMHWQYHWFISLHNVQWQQNEFYSQTNVGDIQCPTNVFMQQMHKALTQYYDWWEFISYNSIILAVWNIWIYCILLFNNFCWNCKYPQANAKYWNLI